MIELDGEELPIEDFRDDWALALMEQGVIVRLSLNRWRATTKLHFEELGLSFFDSETKDFMTKYIDLGHKKLLPPKIINEINTVEQRARMCLKNYSYNTIWGRFVPFSSFIEWKEANDEIRSDFLGLAKSLGYRYDHIISEVKAEYTKMIIDIWKRNNDVNSEPPSSFLEHFTTKVIDKIPNREFITASFKYDTTFFSIPLPSMIEEDIMIAQSIQQDREIKSREHELQLESKRIIAREYQERKKELIDSFLESTVLHLRHHIAELADHIYLVLQRHTKDDLTMTHVKRIKKMIKEVSNLNFQNDEELKRILDGLEEEVSKYKGERDKNIVSKKLKSLVDLAEKEFRPSDFDPLFGFNS